jgi:hypothetical protein
MSETRSFDDRVRVVVEGAPRVIWNRVGDRQWRYAGLWPNEEQERDLRKHVRDGGALLIVVNDLSTTVQALAAELDGDAALGSDDEVVDISVPFLDWMDPEFRRSSVRQITEAQARFRTTPKPLRPPFVLVPSRRSERVVFAVRTSVAKGELSATTLRELGAYAFERSGIAKRSLPGRVAARIGLPGTARELTAV